jgi:large subunit ribosomal protein L4
VKDLAKMSALAYKAKESAIVVVEDMQMDTPKTSQFVNVMKALNVADKKTLVLLPDYNDNVYLSLRNIPSVNATILSDMNTYDIVNAQVLVMSESTAKVFSAPEEEVNA